MDGKEEYKKAEVESGVSPEEFELIQKYAKSRKKRGRELEYESFEGYELPPRTQFSMLKKPAVSIKYGSMSFATAAIRMFEGMHHILPIVHMQKRRLAVIPLSEEESASVEWAKQRKKDGVWTNKQITSLEFIEKLYELMAWNRECRYKVLGRVANSDRGFILVFDLGEAIMFEPRAKEYTDPVTGEIKKKRVKYYPDIYKDCIGRSYNDYVEGRQVDLFENLGAYQSDTPDEVIDQISE